MAETVDWEMCKENTMPIKRGRNPNKLCGKGRGLSVQQDKERLCREQETFEAKIAQIKNNPNFDDPLSIWLKYIKWMQDKHPSGSEELISLFERCTREFKDDARYKNSERYVKIWIGYADMLPNPSSVFKYLRTNGIGDKVALYYVATAWTAERRSDFPLADKAYTVGIEKKAQPIEMLLKRQSEFQRRMARRLLNQMQEGEEGNQENKSDVDENGQKKRSLRAITRKQAASSRRSGTTSMVQGRTAGVSARRKEPKQVPAPKIDVFVDENADFRAHNWGSENPSENGWKVLNTEESSRKENTKKATPWVDQGFADTKNVKPSAPSSFGVYVDDSYVKQEETRNTEKDENTGLKERKKVKKKDLGDISEAVEDVEKLRKNPLCNFDKDLPTTKQISMNELSLSPVSERISTETTEHTKLSDADNEDMTINTKLALDDMFDMFASPSMVEKKKQQSTSMKPSEKKPFSVFAEPKPSPSNEVKKPFSVFAEPKPSPKETKKPFSVFAEPKPSPKETKKPFSVFAEPKPSPKETKKPFSVFAEPKSSPKETKKPFSVFAEPKSSPKETKKPFSVFAETKSSPKETKKPFSVFAEPKQVQTKANGPFSIMEEPFNNEDEDISGALEDQENMNLPKRAAHSWKVDESRVFAVISEDKSLEPSEDNDETEEVDEVKTGGLSYGFDDFEDDDDTLAFRKLESILEDSNSSSFY